VDNKAYNLENVKILKVQLGIKLHAYNPSTLEAEAGGSQVQGQPGLHSETLFQKEILRAQYRRKIE
jgi:hypothetical protein